MRKAVAFAIIVLGVALTCKAADAPAGEDPSYTKSIEKRTQDILNVLSLGDEAKSMKVRDALLAQYRALKVWHEKHDAELKNLGKRKSEGPAVQARIDEIKATLKPTHDACLATLSENLSAQEVEAVKDKMTYNVVHVTYGGYKKMLPNLTQEQQAKILDMLKQAREEAMDGGSSDEKHAVFGRYKGRINNYLSSEGYDLKKASKEWAERERAEKVARETK